MMLTRVVAGEMACTMTSKKYRKNAEAELAELSEIRKDRLSELREQVRQEFGAGDPDYVAELLLEWRPSRPNYELSLEEAIEIAHAFEVAGATVVGAKDSPAAIAFRSAGLDPRNPNHWLYLVDGLAKVLLTRKPKKIKRTRSALDELKADAQAIRATHPKISKSEMVRRLKTIMVDGEVKYTPSEATLMRLLTEAGVRWFTRPDRKRPRTR